jgi:N-acetylglucosaminyldiphosphoundecaprenol N-acetyl-beta-D-mannosaminyltransferase
MQLSSFRCLKTNIVATTRKEGLNALLQRIDSGEGGYVCFSNVHTVVTAYKADDYQNTLNSAYIAFPDGKPVFWVGVAKGNKGIQSVPGPDFMENLLSKYKGRIIRHYFYGSKPEVLDTMAQKVRRINNMAEIVGWESPPFRKLSHDEETASFQRIIRAKPDLIWVGLGAPKQELWMREHAEKLKPAILLGVGAAFDFYADNVKRAPKLMRAMGLEWLYRLSQEPKRLFSRYFVTNSLFVFYLTREMVASLIKPFSDRIRR